MSFTYACEMDILLAVIFCSSRVEMHIEHCQLIIISLLRSADGKTTLLEIKCPYSWWKKLTGKPLLPYLFCQLSSRHLLAVVKYSDVKTFGLQQILDLLLSDLSFLSETGLDLCHDGVTHHVTMAVVGVVGDNLSLHRVGGFKCCFSKDLLILVSILRRAEATV